ncbi:centromere protein K [Gadus macrocephalus]|uniref:centromere protein K n=1 Tax=Gadus macrocephalus TaxID=80720 RepID=UPI0028CB8310|nr:centromere protein K [Gadus macrocephalus]
MDSDQADLSGPSPLFSSTPLLSSSPPLLPSEAPLSEAAEAELLDGCEEQFTNLERIQNAILSCEADFSADPQEQSLNRLKATEAELAQWLQMEPRVLSTNPEILLNAGKDEMQKLVSELEMIAACCEAKRNNLAETLQREQTWLKKRQEVLTAATNHVERLRIERETLSEHSITSVLLDIKKKIKKMKSYYDQLTEVLADILANHFPLPTADASAGKRKKNALPDQNDNLISLNKILELLMNRTLQSPHDPYVAADERFWPPYVEMLLRYSIAVRHPENSGLIRLESFC